MQYAIRKGRRVWIKSFFLRRVRKFIRSDVESFEDFYFFLSTSNFFILFHVILYFGSILKAFHSRFFILLRPFYLYFLFYFFSPSMIITITLFYIKSQSCFSCFFSPAWGSFGRSSHIQQWLDTHLYFAFYTFFSFEIPHLLHSMYMYTYTYRYLF